MSPALNGSSEIQRFEHAYAIEIRDGIMFVFYPGLPHVVLPAIPFTAYLHKWPTVASRDASGLSLQEHMMLKQFTINHNQNGSEHITSIFSDKFICLFTSVLRTLYWYTLSFTKIFSRKRDPH